MIFSEQNTEISAAFVQAWAAIEPPKTNGEVTITSEKKNVSYSFIYTDLAGMLSAVRGAFKEYGLAVMQNVKTDFAVDTGHQFLYVETMIIHSSGQWIKSEPLQMSAAIGSGDLNTVMKQFGSQITYLKRYSLCAMLGITSEKDADAARSNSSNNGGGARRNDTPMPTTAEEAAAMVLPFGKNKNKTLGQIWGEDYSYIEWLQKGEKTDEVYKVAIKLMQDAQQEQQGPPIAVPKNAKEAGAMLAPTEDFPGKTLKELWHEQPGYIAWIEENYKHPAYVTAIQLMRLAVEQKEAAKQVAAQV